MERCVERLGKQSYDLIVIGAGIYGAAIARDASIRGLKVAIVDKGDYCGKTSHNSLKIIHGGIRYLQHLNFKRTLESIQEQQVWLSVAPHLVRPMRCIMPTYGHAMRGPEVMLAGVMLYDLMGWGRNRKYPARQPLPSGAIISRKRCLEILPDIEKTGLTGAAIWYDAQVVDADKAVIEMIASAVENGAEAANYVSAEALLRSGNTVTGVRVKDQITQIEMELKSTVVVNAAGPWAKQVLSSLGNEQLLPLQLPLVESMNVVTHRVIGDYAVALKSQLDSDSVVGQTKRLYFFTPWQENSVIGTTHFPYNGDPDSLEVSRDEVGHFINEINKAYSGLKLTPEDVKYCYKGLTPAEEGGNRSQEGLILDHQKEQGIDGLVTVVGVKYTTARLVAERAVNLIAAKLNIPLSKCQTRFLALPGSQSDIGDINVLSEIDFKEYCQQQIDKTGVVKLQDLVVRRMDLIPRGKLTSSRLQACLDLLAKKQGWDKVRCMEELKALRASWFDMRSIGIIDQVTQDLAA